MDLHHCPIPSRYMCRKRCALSMDVWKIMAAASRDGQVDDKWMRNGITT
jgi:hypothetical protein